MFSLNDPVISVFPPTQIATKILIALGIGLLVGLEREWARKDVGLRTFSLTALLGMLSSLQEPIFAAISLVGVVLLVGFLNLRSVLADRSLELTTSVALIITAVLGVLVGHGHVFTSVASAISMTLLLSWKTELSAFTVDLSLQEIRSAVLMGLLGFVIYPVLPDRFIDPWGLVNPREAWVTVIVLAGIGFVNYVLLRLYKSRGLYLSALLGGLVNSTATVAQLGPILRGAIGSLAVVISLLTIVAMFARNLTILAIFGRAAVPTALWPLAAMLLLAAAYVWKHRREGSQIHRTITLSSPVSLARVLKFGLLFLAINVAGTLAQRHLGRFGFLIVSLIGGAVSSASTTASAALLATHGQLTPQTGGVAVVLASMSSALSNLPVIYQQTKEKELTRAVSVVSFALVLLGLLVLLVRERFLKI
jgi:uncharacterized membrane protein (DUF4010 family)